MMQPFYSAIRRMRYRNKVRHIPAGESAHLVLDIGCGAYPVPEADFVTDIELKSFDHPRMRQRLSGRFVVCDIHNLPFALKSFGFVHCSNVLEHTEDPAQAFSELKRVGRHGFAESPSAFREQIIHHSRNHRWIIGWKNGELITRIPTATSLLGLRIFPIYAFEWLAARRSQPAWRVLWKMIANGLDFLGLAYHQVRW